MKSKEPQHLGRDGRGGQPARAKSITDMAQPWGEAATCTSCGKCVQACPTGALFRQGSTVAEMAKDKEQLARLMTAREKKRPRQLAVENCREVRLPRVPRATSIRPHPRECGKGGSDSRTDNKVAPGTLLCKGDYGTGKSGHGMAGRLFGLPHVVSRPGRVAHRPGEAHRPGFQSSHGRQALSRGRGRRPGRGGGGQRREPRDDPPGARAHAHSRRVRRLRRDGQRHRLAQPVGARAGSAAAGLPGARRPQRTHPRRERDRSSVARPRSTGPRRGAGGFLPSRLLAAARRPHSRPSSKRACSTAANRRWKATTDVSGKET